MPHAPLLGLVALSLVLAGCAAGPARTVSAVDQLHRAYEDQPFSASQRPTPDHEWSFIDTSHARVAFLHWMPHGSSHDAETATELFATGDAIAGKACLGAGGVSQDQIDAGYVHFHKKSAPNWDAGHGWDSKDQEGFWLRHVAVKGGVEMMGPGPSVSGQVYRMMDSTANLKPC